MRQSAAATKAPKTREEEDVDDDERYDESTTMHKLDQVTVPHHDPGPRRLDLLR